MTDLTSPGDEPLPAGPDRSAHPTAEQLAESADGLLPAPEEQTVTTHLLSCPDCAQTAADLATVPDLLARYAAPAGPMPASVAARLDAALAAAAAEAPAEAPAATVVPLAGRAGSHGSRRWRLHGAVLQIAAALVVVAAVGALLVGALHLGGSGTSASTAAKGSGADLRASENGPRYTATGHVYTVTGLVADAQRLQDGSLQRAVEGGARAEAAPSAAARGATAPTVPATSDVAGSGTGPASAPIPTQLPRVPSVTAYGLAATPIPRAQIDACVAALSGSAQPPLAVDQGVFAGEPVLVIVLPVTNQPDKVGIWVVGRDCRPDAEQLRRYVVAPRP